MSLLRIVLLSTVLVFGTFQLAGCERDGAAEKAGEKIDRGLEDAGEAAEEAGEETEEEIEKRKR